MAISEKTRKILWGRSGNLCAICRKNLVAKKTKHDDASVIGEECHIVSRAPKGPRYDSSFQSNLLDEIENLILLCAVHHKIVDDQFETYTAMQLKQLKGNHEIWVASKLEEHEKPTPVQIRRFKDNIPKHLVRVKSAHALMETSTSFRGMYPYYEDDLTDDEIELVGGFIQNLKDWKDLFDDLEPIEQMRAKKAISDEIDHLEESGFFVFSSVEKQRIEGGISAPSDWHMLHVSIVRASNPGILAVKDLNSNLTNPPQGEA